MSSTRNNRGALRKVLFLFGLTIHVICVGGVELQEILRKKDCAGIYGALRSQGFHEIGNRQFLKNDYKKLYGDFDCFIQLMEDDKSFSGRIHALEGEFSAMEEYRARYCSAPPSYRDPRERAKRFDKIYFQFIKEHLHLMEKSHPDLFSYNHDITAFFEGMKAVDTMAKGMFVKIIDSLEVSMPGIKSTLYGKHKELTVISKIVRYKKTDQWGTTPHCDKSGMTLIWDSDDKSNESLLLCEDVQHPSVTKLKRPCRSYTLREDVTSAILIPGLACTKVGIDLKPTVHGVAPIKNEYRHAVISFLLVPDIDLSDSVSDFVEPAAIAPCQASNLVSKEI